MGLELESVRMFIKVAELASFTRAAEQLGMPKARVSLGVRALEAELGVRLLHRTTRTVRTTPDGETFLVRAKRLVADAEEIGSMFHASRALRGRVRIDLPVTLARRFLVPRLPDLLAAHPQLEILLSTTDRRVDVAREGFDCVLRIGALGDSELVALRLGQLAMLNCASPAYVRKYGKPRTLDELDDHLVVHYSTTLGADPPSFEYRDGAVYRQRPMRCLITVNNADAYEAACVAGLGIIQAPRLGLTASIASGELVEILPEHTCEPMPISLVHAHGRNVPKRTRAVMAWIAHVLGPHLRDA